MQQPKILIWDLETGAGINGLRSDLAKVLCFGYKFLGEAKTHVLTIDRYKGWFSKDTGLNDEGILKAALGIMNKADLLVAHFGDKFDRRFFQGRCVIHGLTPPPPTKQRDTWRILRTAFNFSSNRLVNAAMSLGLVEQKHVKTRDEWPGWWDRAAAGNKKAIHDMAEYCAQDVRTTEELYLRIRPYDNPHPRIFFDRARCRLDNGEVQYRGFAYVGENRYRKFQCVQCGRWDRERKAA